MQICPKSGYVENAFSYCTAFSPYLVKLTLFFFFHNLSIAFITVKHDSWEGRI